MEEKQARAEEAMEAAEREVWAALGMEPSGFERMKEIRLVDDALTALEALRLETAVREYADVY